MAENAPHLYKNNKEYDSSKEDPLKNKHQNKQQDYENDWLRGTSACQVPSRKQLNKSAPPIKADFSDPVYKKLSRLNGQINSMTINVLIDNLKQLNLETSGRKEVLSRRLKNFHKEKALNKTIESDFDYVCVIDYEATCSDTQINYPHEIIEFPVVLVNMKTLTIEESFQSYCKPKLNPNLSAFCKSLTGITQEKVNEADEFPLVLSKVSEWFDKYQLGSKYSFAIATDGPWDMQKFLNMQCEHSDIEYPEWGKSWIDVRKLFSNWFGVRRCGILKMLDLLGLSFEGNQHCGLDDSINIARIMIKLANAGCKIKRNSNLKTGPQAPYGKYARTEAENQENY